VTPKGQVVTRDPDTLSAIIQYCEKQLQMLFSKQSPITRHLLWGSMVGNFSDSLASC